jgi:hypothetical protein
MESGSVDIKASSIQSLDQLRVCENVDILQEL